MLRWIPKSNGGSASKCKLYIFACVALYACLADLTFADSGYQALPIKGGGYLNASRSPVVYLESNDSLCTGVLISSTHVLTAKHCIRGYEKLIKNGRFIVAAGQIARKTKSSVTHSKYDIGIIKLRSKVKGITPAKIYPNSHISIGQAILSEGYGETEYGTAGYLKAAYLYVSRVRSDRSHFSASDPIYGSTPCFGDSGGPGLVSYKGKLTVLGIISSGYAGCPYGSPTIFVNVGFSKVRKFITDNLKK